MLKPLEFGVLCVCMYAWTHACVCMHAHVYMRTSAGQTCANVCMHTCMLVCHVSEYACVFYMKRCSFVSRLKKSLAAAVGSARTFFLSRSTRSYPGPLAVSLCVLYPALCPFSGRPITEADSKSSLHKQTGKGPPPPASLQGHSSLGRILCCHGDVGVPPEPG